MQPVAEPITSSPRRSFPRTTRTGTTPRQNVAARRELAERLLHRAWFLSPPDRSLIHGALDAGMSPAQIAQLAGVCPETVRRRIRKLVAHLSSDLFTFILSHRGGWPVAKRRVADLRFLQRCSLRETTVRADMSMHRVRRFSDAILAQYEALQPRWEKQR